MDVDLAPASVAQGAMRKGRPPRKAKDDQGEPVRCNVILPARIWEDARILAIRRRCSLSEIVTAALKRELAAGK